MVLYYLGKTITILLKLISNAILKLNETKYSDN